MQKARIECAHKRTVRSGPDTVCTGCGTVLDADGAAAAGGGMGGPAGRGADVDRGSIYDRSESRTNLYERNAVGSRNAIPKTEQTRDLRRYMRAGIRSNSDPLAAKHLSQFSNCCERLVMGDAETEYAWRTFLRAMRAAEAKARAEAEAKAAADGGEARPKPNRKTAETACWAIYKACKAHGVPLTAGEIHETARREFGRKKLQHMTGILFAHMESEAAAPQDDGAEYYFRTHLKRMLGGKRYGEKRFAAAMRDAWYMYRNVFVAGSNNARATQAIGAVFGA